MEEMTNLTSTELTQRAVSLLWWLEFIRCMHRWNIVHYGGITRETKRWLTWCAVTDETVRMIVGLPLQSLKRRTWMEKFAATDPEFVILSRLALNWILNPDETHLASLPVSCKGDFQSYPDLTEYINNPIENEAWKDR